MIAKWNKWLVLLLRKWLRIQNEEHRHWCCFKHGDDYIPAQDRCYHSGVCWYCTDPFCVDVERKNCPNCVAGKPKTCKGKSGRIGERCTCGYGRN